MARKHRGAKETEKTDDTDYQATIETFGELIESVQDFWRIANNTPIDKIKMRESIYLFKQGFKPIWEDRRNFQGGSWTFRIPKANGPDFWTRVQLMAIGEKLQESLEEGEYSQIPLASHPLQQCAAPRQSRIPHYSHFRHHDQNILFLLLW